MTTKEGPPFAQHEELVGRIRTFMDQRGVMPNGDLLTKTDAFVIESLQLRAAGDSAIQLWMTGDSGDPIYDKYSNNRISVCVPDGASDTGLTLESNLMALNQAYRGDMALLIGIPDRWIYEDPQTRAVRLVGKINTIDKEIYNIFQGRPTARTNELNGLKAQTAESIFALLSESMIKKESIRDQR